MKKITNKEELSVIEIGETQKKQKELLSDKNKFLVSSCFNQIAILGDKFYLDKLRNKIIDYKNKSEDDITDFMEYLVGLGDIPSDYYETGWARYRTDRFGTFMNVNLSDLEFNFMTNRIQIIVISALLPVIPFLSKLCKKYNLSAVIQYVNKNIDIEGGVTIDTSGDIVEDVLSIMEDTFRNDNNYYWQKMESYIENIERIDELENFMDYESYLGEKDRNRIRLLWHLKKDI